jgi:hypothetical protein
MKFQTLNNIQSIALFRSVVLVLLLILSCSSEEKAAKQEQSNKALPQISTLLPADNAISGYQPAGKPTVYTRQDIWDYLSQEAEIYLTNSFVSMAVEKFSGSGGDTLIVELSQFGNDKSAFALFSSHRNPGFKSVDLDPLGYIDSHRLYYAKGDYYLRIIGTDKTSDESLVQAAKAIVPGLEGSPYVDPQLKYLPTEGMVPNSIEISLKDNLAHNEPPNLVSALYQIDSDTVRVFYQHKTRMGMTFAVDEFLDDGGKVDEYLMGGVYQSLVGSAPKYGKVYCAVDSGSVCAVTGFSDIAQAKEMVQKVFGKTAQK